MSDTGTDRTTADPGPTDPGPTERTDDTGSAAPDDPAGAEAPAVEESTYQLLRARLEAQAADLATATRSLNERRLELFGSTELAAVASERIRTENNCVPRDIVAVGPWMLFGYNVFIGLRSETTVADVFALHRLDRDAGFTFTEVPVDGPESWLTDPSFLSDFRSLYTYYKDARLLTLRVVGQKLLMIFQIGERLDDLRVFRWGISRSGELSYIDDRGERDHVYPPSQDFEWTVATRDDQVLGRYPHVNVLDTVFIETIGGDLTIKVEDNTETGLGIHSEPVAEADQALSDADIAYARVGSLVLLMVRPYKEHEWRHFVFDTKTRTVERIDAIGVACRQLPEDDGIIFPGGYHLMTGETKQFSADIDEMIFVEEVHSPNGEDVLYSFGEIGRGTNVLLSYNVIRKQLAQPIRCHGYARFDDGTLVVFRAGADDQPTRVHTMQVWETPYMTPEVFAERPRPEGVLATIGNPELVRAISDALAVVRLVDESTPSQVVYEDLVSSIDALSNEYHWLGDPEAGDLSSLLGQLASTAELVVTEFEKTEGQRRRAAAQVADAAERLDEMVRELRTARIEDSQQYVEALSALRRQRGHLRTLRDVRYVDRGALDRIEDLLVTELDALSGRAIDFLAAPDALSPYGERIEALEVAAGEVGSASDAEPLDAELADMTAQMETLVDVIGGLDIGDATLRTGILERISAVMGQLNRSRALLDHRRTELRGREAVAEFAAEFLLLEQAVTGALALATEPEQCDEQLAALTLRIETLDARFGDLEDFGPRLATKRDDVYEAFTSRRQSLLDARQRRTQRLVDAANRILASIGSRVEAFTELDDINSFFASDQLVSRVHAIADELRSLGAGVESDEVETRLKAAREDAARSLRDRADLFEGADVVRLGTHRFTVNAAPLELSLAPGADGIDLLLTGTDYRRPVTDPEFVEATRPYWDQLVVSETEHVYRAEYLAGGLLLDALDGTGEVSLDQLRDAATAGESGLLALVQRAAESRYDEGYERGVHDHDAARILDRLLHLHETAGLLRYGARARAAAQLHWALTCHDAEAAALAGRATSLGRLRDTYGATPALGQLGDELAARIAAWHEVVGLPVTPPDAVDAGRYLLEELTAPEPSFTTTRRAVELRDAFVADLERRGQRAAFDDSVAEVSDVAAAHRLVTAWLEAFAATGGSAQDGSAVSADDLTEVATVLLTGSTLSRTESAALTELEAEDLLGRHPLVRDRTLTVRIDDLLGRVDAFRRTVVPGFRDFQRRRRGLLDREQARLRLDELQPKVMTTFVRNHLIDEAYLPLIGDNLARQLGTAGQDGRTDRSGLLLLISPPGYGKTTLMEYVAHRLGLVFVKVNGPALGHQVTSVDPADAPNATAAQEVDKINLALEMGNNVMLYVDDIQHTNPELLQKFISLCDAQRRMEGVWQGQTRTYDLRGKRVAVCMAGNPYTESGETFRVPDMLANRADTYNLGDVLSGRREVFELSYIENALTSNPVLAPLTTHDRGDVALLVRMARGESVQADRLSHPWAGTELEDVLSVMRKALRIQEVVLAVNELYIASAAQADEYRTEPPFQLQGSYRNMAKLVERVVPPMTPEELEDLLDDHYTGEAQTLTTGAEWNLLRLAELRGTLGPDERERIDAIRDEFRRRAAIGGDEDDPTTRIILQLSSIVGGLSELGDAVRSRDQGDADRSLSELRQSIVELRGALDAVRHDGAVAREGASEQAAASATALAAEIERVRADVADRVAGADAEIERLRRELSARPRTEEALGARLGEISATLATLAHDLPAVVAAVSGRTAEQARPERRFYTAQTPDGTTDVYWEVDVDGWAVRQVEVHRDDGSAIAAASLEEWRAQGMVGRLGEGTSEGEFTERALDPADPSVKTRAIDAEAFEAVWRHARRELGQRDDRGAGPPPEG